MSPIETPARLRRLGIRLMERARRTDALALLDRLETSQWQSGEMLGARQKADLRAHLVHCRDHVPYWRELFATLDFAPERLADLGALAALPILGKAAIREAGDALRADDFASRGPRAKCTSGSTGMPLNYYLDFTSHSHLWAHIWRAWGQTGYRPGDLYATLSGGSLLPDKVDLKQRVYLALSAVLHLPSYHLTPAIMDRYARLLERRRVRFLYGYPSSLDLFATHLLARGARPLPLQAVFTTSELLTAQARANIEHGLGAPVFDTYGCNDGGLYAFECAEHAGYHQAMESCVVEIVDDDGRPLPDGEVGRIVTTHLANKAHPFLRYETGDLGALDRTPCACGRGLPRIVELQGRVRDMVVTPDGRSVHGAFFNHFEPFYAAEWLERFQVHQPDRDHLVVRMIVGRPPTAAERTHIVDELRRGLGDMEISLVEVAELELTRTGKFRVVVSDVE